GETAVGGDPGGRLIVRVDAGAGSPVGAGRAIRSPGRPAVLYARQRVQDRVGRRLQEQLPGWRGVRRTTAGSSEATRIRA
ncbi:MAG: hypothetical protein WAW53_05765, partial [Candidatus Dormiibacterota bacterium]